MAALRLPRLLLVLTVSSLLLNEWNGPAETWAQSAMSPQPGCTTLYAYDGRAAWAGNNEDFNNPLTYLWFIPAGPERYGRVLFGYDDYIPQGGLNDQGLFFDGLALPYKAMPETSQRPSFPDGDMAFVDEILARSANVQEVIDIVSRWNRAGGEYAQWFFGDRFGDSVIIDGDTILRKQGAFQLATNFRLADQPNPPYPDDRYGTLQAMLAQADHYDVDLFRRALDAAHAEGDFPTLYSQIYELNTGLIHLYQFHDFQHEVVLNLADELAKGPHIVTIASLFPPNDALAQWTAQRVQQWQASTKELFTTTLEPDSQQWMSGPYVLPGQVEGGSVTVYLENGQLYMQRANQFPIQLYPVAPDAVAHRFFNGMDLTLTFSRNLWGQVTGAQGTFSFEPYNIAVPYDLARPGVVSYNTSLWITTITAGLVPVLLGGLFVWWRRRRTPGGAAGEMGVERVRQVQRS